MFKNNDALIKELRSQIDILRAEKKELQDRIMCLLDTDVYKTYKMWQNYQRANADAKPKRPQTYDYNTKQFRDMTDEEINRDLEGLKELGIV